MKLRPIIYIGILFSAACNRPTNPLQAGDLLFVASGGSAMTEAIRAATASQGALPYTHVGMVTEGADSVIEATSPEGVRTIALAEFVAAGAAIDGGRCVVAKRLRLTEEADGGAAIAREAVRQARRRIGADYDLLYRAGDDRYYCSELVQEAYADAAQRPIFPSLPMRFRDDNGEMPAYWVKLFASFGESIPEGEPGTNPAAMAEDERLQEVHRWF